MDSKKTQKNSGPKLLFNNHGQFRREVVIMWLCILLPILILWISLLFSMRETKDIERKAISIKKQK